MSNSDTAVPKQRDSSVLIVDDTPANISLLRNMLLPQGYQIFVATSGEIALKIAAQVHPDLILLDVMMPGMDGFETCRRLKSNDDTSGIPIIFVTAKTDTQDIVEGFNIGAVDYINKPIRIEEVCIRVRTQLQIRHHIEKQRAQTEKMRAIVNNMAEGLLIIEADGKIQFTNPACDHFLGYDADQLIGHSFAELLSEPLAKEYLDYFAINANEQHAKSKAAPQLGTREVLISHSSGNTLCMDLTITPMFLQQPLYIGLLHDISIHKRSEDALMHLAHIDRLTNIANRRHFDSVLQKEWHRAARSGLPITLVLLDVDHFKLYNDTLGHQAGDRCLQKVAQAIQTHAKRPTDIAARYGGEEFVLLFAETPIDAAGMLAENVRISVESLRLPHPQSSASTWVTVSVGVATIRPNPDHDPDILFETADKAMYRAKEEGRNRVRATMAVPDIYVPTLPQNFKGLAE